MPNRSARGLRARWAFSTTPLARTSRHSRRELRERATRLAQDPEFRSMLRRKHESRLDDELVKPLAAYRADELERMKINFFGPDPAYHEARRRFVFKGNPPPRERRAPISIETERPALVFTEKLGDPMPEIASWSAASLFADSHANAVNSEVKSARNGEAFGLRLLAMVRRGVAAVQLRGDR